MKTPQAVRVGIFEPDRDLRSAIRGMLYDVGFREILDTDRPDRIVEALADNSINLLVTDTHPENSEMCQTFRDVRHGKIGANPLPVGISITDDADYENITTAVDAGFDNVLLKPLSPMRLQQRIRMFASERKPFVVTSNYIGPDRRKKTRTSASGVRLLSVPNPLELLASGMPRDDVMWRVKDARMEIDEEKVIRDMDSLTWLADRISKSFVSGAPPRETRL